MDELGGIGRLLIWTGVVIVGLGLGLLLVAQGGAGSPSSGLKGFLGGLVGWLGHLPGDLSIKGERYAFYFPLATSVLVSLVLSLLWYLVGFLGKR